MSEIVETDPSHTGRMDASLKVVAEQGWVNRFAAARRE
jgi:hypothetical protein